jgi:hypothetical protein
VRRRLRPSKLREIRDPTQLLLIGMEVFGGGSELSVPEELLEGAQVGPVPQHAGVIRALASLRSA